METEHLQFFILFGGIFLVQGVPWEPESRSDQWWIDMHNSFVERTANSNGDIKIIFFGASITNWWPQAIWEEKFAPLGAVNYGISGDGVEHALFRILNGEVDGLSSTLELIVFADCGSNNVGAGYSSDDIVRGYNTFIQVIREKLPDTKILLMGLMPRDDGNTDRWTRLVDTNIKNSKHDSGEMESTIKYVDLWNQFSQSWLTVEPNLFVDDKLHLTDQGYVKWAQIIEPVIKEMSK